MDADEDTLECADGEAEGDACEEQVHCTEYDVDDETDAEADGDVHDVPVV